MRFKCSKTAVIFPYNDQIIVFDYLSKRAAAVSVEVMHWYNAFTDWRDVDDVASSHPECDRQTLIATVESMVACGLLIASESIASIRQQQYEETWKWGPLAGTFHFATQDLEFISLEDSQADSLTKSVDSPSPPLNWHDRYNTCRSIQLQIPPSTDPFFEMVSRRRSSRNPLARPIKLDQLAACLYSGLAITGHVRMPTGDLPLTPTPSGGARNPYEAFVLVQDVQGLDRGIYHYSNLHHQLRLVSSALPNHPADLLAGQDWANPMPALIFLVAVLERTMWKYAEDSAYKIVMIEGGHIGQNIMLAATAQGLSSCPTAALAHSLVSNHLGLDQMTHTPVYAIALCYGGAYDAEIVPNLHLGAQPGSGLSPA